MQAVANEEKWHAYEQVKERKTHQIEEGPKLEAIYPLANDVSKSLVIFFPDTQHYLSSIDCFGGISRLLANELGSIVVVVETRLAPEFKYPVPLDDAELALEFLLGKEGREWVGADLVDPARVFIVSNGSGCSLSLGVLQRIGEKITPPIAGKVFIMPQLQPTCDSPSYHRVGDQYPLYSSTSRSKYSWEHYKPNDISLEEFSTKPDVNPLHSPTEVLKRTPKSLIYTADCDPREDDGIQLFQKLAEANVQTEHISMKVCFFAGVNSPS